MKTAKGRRMPLDAAPAENGNLIVVDGVAVPQGQVVFEDERERSLVLRTSHFATCPNASEHRRQP